MSKSAKKRVTKKSPTAGILETTLLSSNPKPAKIIKTKALEERSIAQEELAALIKRLGIATAPDGLPTLEIALVELKSINDQLALATDVTYSGDIQALLEKLVVAQDRFNAVLKSTQISYLESIIETCGSIESDISTNKLFNIPTHVEDLRVTLGKLETMPSLAAFENENAKLAQLVALAPKAGVDESVLRTHEYQRSSALITSAFAKSAESMMVFIKNWEKAEGEHLPIPESSKMSLETRVEVTNNITSVVQNSIKNKRRNLDLLLGKKELIETEITAIDSELRAISEQAKKVSELHKEVTEAKASEKSHRTTLERTNAAITKARMPKPFSFGRFFGKLFNTKTYRTSIEREKEEIDSLESGKREFTLKLEAARKTVEAKRAKEITETKKLEQNKKIKAEKEEEKLAKLGEYEKKQGEIDILQGEIAIAEGTLGSIIRISNSPLERPEAIDRNLSTLVAEAKSYSEELTADPIIQRVVKYKADEDAKIDSKQKAFRAAIIKRFHRAFTIASLVKEGAVTLPNNMLGGALDMTKAVIDQISVPIVQQGLQALVLIAKFANKRNQGNRNDRVANFSEDPAIIDMVNKIADTLVESYSCEVDNNSPLNHLNEDGLKAFADTIVDKTIASVADRRPPWTAKKEITAIDKESMEARDKVVGEIAEEVDKELGERDESETDEEASKKVAHAIVGWIVEGNESSRFSNHFFEVGKRYFKDTELEDPKVTTKWNVTGLLKRVGIITSSGERFVSGIRKEGGSGEGSKYGWRLALPTEEKKIKLAAAAKAKKDAATASATAAAPSPTKEGSILPGYVRFASAVEPLREELAKKRQSLLDKLTKDDFINPDDQFHQREALLDDLIKGYVDLIEDRANIETRRNYLKSNTFLKVGTSATYIFGVTRDSERERFNKLADEITSIADTRHKLERAEAKTFKGRGSNTVAIGLQQYGPTALKAVAAVGAAVGGNLDGIESAIRGGGESLLGVAAGALDRASATAGALRSGAEIVTGAASQADMDRISTAARDAVVAGGGAITKATTALSFSASDALSRAREILRSEAEILTDATTETVAGVADRATSITRRVATLPSKAEEIAKDAIIGGAVGVVDLASRGVFLYADNEEALEDGKGKIEAGIEKLQEYQKPTSMRLQERQLVELFHLCNRVQGILERAEGVGAEITKESDRKDFIGYEDILKDAEKSHYIRIKRDEDGTVIDVKLFAKKRVGQAVEKPLFEPRTGKGITAECKSEIDDLCTAYETAIERKRGEVMIDTLGAGKATGRYARPSIETVASAESEDAEEAESRIAVDAGNFFERSARKKTDLIDAVQHLVGHINFPTSDGLQEAIKEIGGKIDGRKITMPGILLKGEKAASYLVIDLDSKGTMTDVQLFGGDRKDHKRELYDGTSIKEKHATTVPTLLSHYSEILAKHMTPSTSVKQSSSVQLDRDRGSIHD